MIFVYSQLLLHRFITNQHNDQLPVGLLAQLVEQWTGITEVMGSNPIQDLVVIIYCEDRLRIPAHVVL